MTAQHYAEQLKGSEGWRWLRDRGLEAETIREATLGYVDEPLEGHERFEDAVVIPYFDGLGRERFLRFRHLDPGVMHKYDQPEGSGMHIYMPWNADADEVYITEGELDALLLQQLGYPAVGLPGTQGFKEPWVWLFRDTDKVHVVFDGDQPGQEAAGKLAGRLSRVTAVRVVEMPEDMDVTDLYQEDPDTLEALLE